MNSESEQLGEQPIIGGQRSTKSLMSILKSDPASILDAGLQTMDLKSTDGITVEQVTYDVMMMIKFVCFPSIICYCFFISSMQTTYLKKLSSLLFTYISFYYILLYHLIYYFILFYSIRIY